MVRNAKRGEEIATISLTEFHLSSDPSPQRLIGAIVGQKNAKRNGRFIFTYLTNFQLSRNPTPQRQIGTVHVGKMPDAVGGLSPFFRRVFACRVILSRSGKSAQSGPEKCKTWPKSSHYFFSRTPTCRDIPARSDLLAQCGPEKCETWRENCLYFPDEFTVVERS